MPEVVQAILRPRWCFLKSTRGGEDLIAQTTCYHGFQKYGLLDYRTYANPQQNRIDVDVTGIICNELKRLDFRATYFGGGSGGSGDSDAFIVSDISARWCLRGARSQPSASREAGGLEEAGGWALGVGHWASD